MNSVLNSQHEYIMNNSAQHEYIMDPTQQQEYLVDELYSRNNHNYHNHEEEVNEDHAEYSVQTNPFLPGFNADHDQLKDKQVKVNS